MKLPTGPNHLRPNDFKVAKAFTGEQEGLLKMLLVRRVQPLLSGEIDESATVDERSACCAAFIFSLLGDLCVDRAL